MTSLCYVLLPTTGNLYAAPAADLAKDLAVAENAGITMLNVGRSADDKTRATMTFRNLEASIICNTDKTVIMTRKWIKLRDALKK